MRLPARLTAWLFDLLLRRVALRRKEDFFIQPERDYLRRWYVIPRNRLLNVYLHEIRNSDDDRALHDHPWVNCSILLNGSYAERTIAAGGVETRTVRRAGEIKLRRARAAHRLELIDGHACWTLFVTGPRLREWGFHCPNGWRRWQDFTSADGRSVGAGCGEEHPRPEPRP